MRFERFEPGRAGMLKVSGKLSEVKAGDVVFKGPVKRVSEPRRSRSGRMLMVIVIDHGTYEEQWAVDPDREANWQRPE
jgi:hypothetical protein